MSTVTRKQAEAALAAVKHQFRAYTEPLVVGEHTYPGDPEPTLVENWNGEGWAIVWEDGPDDWAYRATVGGSSEEERVLAAQASAEFGTTITVPEEAPVAFPEGVHAEPYYSFVLSLHSERA